MFCFRFPSTNSPCREKWVRCLLEMNPEWISFYALREKSNCLLICSLHFFPSQIIHRFRQNVSLDPDIVPRVLGPCVYMRGDSFRDPLKNVRIGLEFSCDCGVSLI